MRVEKSAEVNVAHGSFHIAQMLCHEMCLSARVLERCDSHHVINSSLEVVREHVLDELGRAFYEKARRIATLDLQLRASALKGRNV
jgi:hypothetical protein